MENPTNSYQSGPGGNTTAACQFMAQDAFAYVDAYRKSILKGATILEAEKDRLEKQYWESTEANPKLAAEFRAVQDALLYVTTGEEPGLVTLGNAEGSAGKVGQAELNECRSSVDELMNQRDDLNARIRQLRNQDSELQAYVVQARQQTQAMRRRMAQGNSTFMVVLTAMFIVILVQMYLLWSH